MSISEHKHVSEGEAAPARRIEIFTGAGRRRSWTEQEKAAIVAESFEDGARASHVARRHGLTPQQLFTWRREARRKAGDEASAPRFVPAIVEAPSAPATPATQAESKATAARPPIIELDIDGSSVWIWRGAETTMVTAIVGALKGRK
jgi:transposase